MFTYTNTRQQELAAVADLNQGFFQDFCEFLTHQGYESLHAFVHDPDSTRAHALIMRYLIRPLPKGVALHDGVARPYAPAKAKWLFLGWVLREAPEQRLRPMLPAVDGTSPKDKKATLLNQVRETVQAAYPDPQSWTWHSVREVFIDRLEGSRRAIKGTLFEAIVRQLLGNLIAKHRLPLTLQKSEIKMDGETYDVSVQGPHGQLLIPVKTRETMGGGHAGIYTRDIHKAIDVANAAGHACVPIIVAESWYQKLDGLAADAAINIPMNPTLIAEVKPRLKAELFTILPLLQGLCAPATPRKTVCAPLLDHAA